MSVLDGGQMARHGLFALVIGVVSAFASIVLCLVVSWAYDAVLFLPWLIFALPVFGVLSLALYKAFKLPLDTTTHSVVNDIRRNQEISPLLAPGILIGTALSILGGASVGKEAGALHMGASLGDLVARPFKLQTIYRKDQEKGPGHEGMHAYAAATGMAATFAALFFAPLGSAMFVLELSRYKRDVVKHLPTMLLACFVAYLIASAIGIGDVIAKVPLPELSWPVIGQCVIIGAMCALVGTIYIKSIDGLQHVTKKISKNYFLWVVLGGLIMILLVNLFGWQNFEGTGGNQLALALQGKQETWGFAIKALLTVVCLGLWFRGGEIMPTFTVGALLGATCTVMTGGDAGYSAAIGLVAFFAAMSRCPWAAFFMGCEIFGWQGAPLFAIAIIVSFSMGKDVGMYGRGATSALRNLMRANRKGYVESIAVEKKEHGQATLDKVISRGRSMVVQVEDMVEHKNDPPSSSKG